MSQAHTHFGACIANSDKVNCFRVHVDKYVPNGSNLFYLYTHLAVKKVMLFQGALIWAPNYIAPF